MMNKVLFGIDIGGTTVKCGLFTLNGELLEKSEIPTDKQDNGSRILSDVAAHIRNILGKRCRRSVGRTIAMTIWRVSVSVCRVR